MGYATLESVGVVLSVQEGQHTVPKPAGGGIGVIAGFAVGHVAMGVPLDLLVECNGDLAIHRDK